MAVSRQQTFRLRHRRAAIINIGIEFPFIVLKKLYFVGTHLRTFVDGGDIGDPQGLPALVPTLSCVKISLIIDKSPNTGRSASLRVDQRCGKEIRE